MAGIINVDEADRAALAMGARALLTLGNDREAVALDKMARQAAACLHNATRDTDGVLFWRRQGVKTWRDMPTTLTREPRL